MQESRFEKLKCRTTLLMIVMATVCSSGNLLFIKKRGKLMKILEYSMVVVLEILQDNTFFYSKNSDE